MGAENTPWPLEGNREDVTSQKPHNQENLDTHGVHG